MKNGNTSVKDKLSKVYVKQMRLYELYPFHRLTANAVAGRTPPPADTEPGCGSP